MQKLFENNKISAIIFLIITAGYIVYSLSFFKWFVDDLFIYFRYAENFASGKGIVFNEGERIEGFSGILWFLILSFYAFLKLPLLEASKITTLLLSVSILYLLFKTGLKYGILYAVMALSICFLNLPFILWSTSGMDIILHTFILLFSLLIISEENNRVFLILPLLLFLLSISRPEGIAVSLVLLIYYLTGSDEKNNKIVSLILYVILFVLFIAFRLLYFGEWLPNTFYAKLGNGLVGEYEIGIYKQGIKYVINFLLNNPQFILVLLSFLFIEKIKNKRTFIFCIILIFVQFSFIIYSGGDWMTQFRFVVPVIPVFSFLLLNLKDVFEGKLLMTVNVLIVVISLFSLITADRKEISRETLLWNNVKDVAQEMKKEMNTKGLMAIGSTGVIPYYLNNMKIIDFVGLNDKYVARNGKRFGLWFERSAPDYVLSKNPDWIILWKVMDNSGTLNYDNICADIVNNDKFASYNYIKTLDVSPEAKMEIFKKNESSIPR